MAMMSDLPVMRQMEFQTSDNVKWVFRTVVFTGDLYVDCRKYCRFHGKDEMKPTKKGLFVREDFFRDQFLPAINKFFENDGKGQG